MNGRPLRCTRCDDTVRVYEIPLGTTRWRIDPTRYLCPECRVPVREDAQLAIDPDPVVFGVRDEVAYDPALAAFPEGY